MNNADLLDSSMAWMDELWDEDASLLWAVRRDRHITRETAWYALGLLQRRSPGDLERARRALGRVIDFQFVAPGAAFDGTFKRAPEEADPPDDPVMWIHYDPNWRQFIGTTFALVCDRFGADLGAELDERLRRSVEHAVTSEPDGRVADSYANIALMKAWLDVWSGRTDAGHEFAARVAARFAEHGAFLEYNSPTYYGIDLYALALWRGSTPKLAALGAELEEALWRDIAAFYHAGLRTLCGPFDRAYGMDMNVHATPLGLWMWTVLGAGRAPFPDPTHRFSHPHDFCMAPCMTMLDTIVPLDAMSHFEAFLGERTIERTVTRDPLRVATAWLSDDVMFGGWSGPTSGIGWFQHHHATIHWRRSDAGVGTARLLAETEADATVTPGELRITTRSTAPVTFDVRPPPRLEAGGWSCDGIDLRIETDARGVSLTERGVTYEPAGEQTTFVIRV